MGRHLGTRLKSNRKKPKSVIAVEVLLLHLGFKFLLQEHWPSIY